MQPTPPDLTPYQQLLDTLLRYDSGQQVADHLAADDSLLDRILLHTLSLRPAPDEAVAQEQEWLQLVLAQLLGRKCLAEYLRCSDTEAFAYAVANPELLTEENYVGLGGVLS